MSRHYYALSDRFTGPMPREYTSGFANTSEVIAFESAAARAEWLRDTRLLKAKALTRAEALRYSKIETECGSGDRGHFAALHNADGTQVRDWTGPVETCIRRYPSR